jgi:photosynthetic reaction center cytochrome c subunit
MRLCLAAFLGLIPLLAQPPQRPAPKNLKLLKAEDVRATMGAFRTALGVQCTACHVQGDFASDENPKKETGRKMIVMTREINAKFPDGKQHVTCFTCHRGATEPATAPPAAAPAP